MSKPRWRVWLSDIAAALGEMVSEFVVPDSIAVIFAHRRRQRQERDNQPPS